MVLPTENKNMQKLQEQKQSYFQLLKFWKNPKSDRLFITLDVWEKDGIFEYIFIYEVKAGIKSANLKKILANDWILMIDDKMLVEW